MHDFFSSIGQVIAGAFITVMASIGFVPAQAPVVQEPTLGVALPSAVAVFETSLASPITSSASSMTLTANSVRGGSTLSGYNCFTVDEGRTDAEFICGTVSGTAVSSLERGLDPVTGTSTNATLQFAHRRGAVVKITDFPHVQRMRNILNGAETVPNLMSYDTDVLITVGSPTSTIATKYYVDNVAVAGASNADTSTKGIVEIATAEETKRSTALGGTGAVLALPASLATTTRNALTASGTIPVTDSTGFISKAFTNYADPAGFTIGTLTATTTFTSGGTSTFSNTNDGATTLGANLYFNALASTTISGATLPKPVFLATTTNSLVLSSTNSTTTDFLGFAILDTTNGATNTVQIEGIVPGFSGLTRGAPYWVTATGTIGTTPTAGGAMVGYAISSTELLIDKDDRSWTYLGSATCTTAVHCSAPAYTRFAIVNVVGLSGNTNLCGGPSDASSNYSLTLAKYGANTSIGVATAPGCGGTNSNSGQHSVSASWTGSGITVTLGVSSGTVDAGTITAYFYR